MALLLLGFLLDPATSQRPPQMPAPAQLVSYRCNDLVVVGRFENLNYEHIDIEGDILGHGWMNARIKVSQVLAGRTERGEIRVRYFGHTYYRADRSFVLVISRARQSKGLLRSAHLIDGSRRPRLATACA